METLHPKLRFPEFKEEWYKEKIQKLIEDKIILSHLDGNHGALYPKSNEFSSTGIPYVTANDFINGKVELDNSKKVSLSRAKLFKKGIAKNGDVLFAHNATVGPAALLETNLDYVILSTTATYFRCDNEKLYNLYLRYYLITDSFIEQYTKVMSQSTRNQVPITTQRSFNITLPTFEEQTRIANFLSSVDEKINLLKEKKALLEEYKKGIMQKIFNQEIRFKDDNGNDFEDWEEKCLGQILVKNSRKNKNHIVTYVESISNKFGFVSQEDYFDSNNIASKNLSNYYVIENGFFAYNPSRINVGSLAYKKDHKTSVISPLYISFKTKDEINDFFLLNYFDTLNFVNQMNASFEGSVRNTLSYESLVKIKISLPNLVEQTKIANFLSAIDEKIELVSNQIQDTQEYKKGLLQQMFV